MLHRDDRDNLQDLVQTSRQCVFTLGDRHKQICAQRRLDLHADTVRVGAEESAQAKVLFDPIEE